MSSLAAWSLLYQFPTTWLARGWPQLFPIPSYFSFLIILSHHKMVYQEWDFIRLIHVPNTRKFHGLKRFCYFHTKLPNNFPNVLINIVWTIFTNHYHPTPFVALAFCIYSTRTLLSFQEESDKWVLTRTWNVCGLSISFHHASPLFGLHRVQILICRSKLWI